MIRKVLVVTGTRAEYGILKPLIKEIKSSKKLELNLVVTGLHLLDEYGLTVNEIKKDGFKFETIKMYNPQDNLIGHSFSRGIFNFTNKIKQLNPDIIVVYGDRLEMLSVTLSASLLNIPIAHIFGGDKTDSGHIDESIRHSITRFSHIHFTATKQHSKRLIKMGEQKFRIHQIGVLGFDSIKDKLLSKKQLSKKLGINLEKKIIICLFHPNITERKIAGKQMGNILKALNNIKKQAIIIYPNNDEGSKSIIHQIENNGKQFITFKNLEHNLFLSLMKYSSVMIGNSSSGIVESPYFKLPVVNIGLRNTGREHASNVIFVDAKVNEIVKAIKKAIDKSFREKIKKCKSPYNCGNSSKKIIKILEEVKLSNKLMKKLITY